MFGLSAGLTVLLVLCVLCVCVFEFINGFHDTANAVATVIYTKTLKPIRAVVFSGILNGIGVFLGGVGVAMSIINLLPVETLVDQNTAHSLGMVGAILLTAIFWNLGTWYLGIPASSSHTLIGSILGVGIAYSLLPGTGDAAVNWQKAGHIGMSLLFSPLFGFAVAMLLMYLLVAFLGRNKSLFDAPEENTPPPAWIRGILILTCGLVSFFHGSNDGQKGIGLMMLILIGLAPAYFALDQNKDPRGLSEAIQETQSVVRNITEVGEGTERLVADLQQELDELRRLGGQSDGFANIPDEQRFEVRKQILLFKNTVKKLHSAEDVDAVTKEKLDSLRDNIATYTDYAPFWVVVLIALSLGIGTMIGWKRIVVTIGEKIGKTHLSYAQGASAELVAASTIGLSTFLHLPVSTTHVLSSGIAGTMFARGGKDNLEKSTITKILLAWVLTLPVCVTMSGTLFLLFRSACG